MSASSKTAGNPSEAASSTPRRSSKTPAVVAVVIVVLLVIAGVYWFYLRPAPATSSAPNLLEGGFTGGQVVTFVYNGTNTYFCTPGLLTFYANATQAAGKTPCEVGAANQTSVVQVPEWVLIPAFAGLSVFGATSLGANDRGFPQVQGKALLTDCGAGGTPTACVDHPTYLYSPLFSKVERYVNITNGYNGLPEGVLPTPAHDPLLNTSTTFPNVAWGTIAVLVFDPNIWPSRSSGSCSATVTSNLSSPTKNCLTSLSALDAALTTSDSAVANANKGEPIWQALGDPSTEVVIPGDLTISEINNLNSNLYIPFAVQPGPPPSFPS